MAMEQRIVEPIVDKIDTFLAQKKPIVTIHEENLEIDARSGDVAWPLCVRLSSWKNVRPLEEEFTSDHFATSTVVQLPSLSVPLGSRNALTPWLSSLIVEVNKVLRTLSFEFVFDDYKKFVKYVASSNNVKPGNIHEHLRDIPLVPSLLCNRYLSSLEDGDDEDRLTVGDFLTPSELREIAEVARAENRPETWRDRPSLL